MAEKKTMWIPMQQYVNMSSCAARGRLTQVGPCGTERPWVFACHKSNLVPPTTSVEDVLLHLQHVVASQHRWPSLTGARGHQFLQQVQIPTGCSWGMLETEPAFLSQLAAATLQWKDFVHQGFQAEVFVLDATAVIGSSGQDAPESARRCTMCPPL